MNKTISIEFRSPIKVGRNEGVSLSKFAEQTGRTIHVRKNRKGKYLTMNSIIGFFYLRIKKNDIVTLLCDYDDGAEEILNQIKREFESFKKSK